MGKLTSDQLNEIEYNNYEAGLNGETYEFHAVSARQAWFLTYDWTNGVAPEYLIEVDRFGHIVRELTD
jgi:hypothetical protein